MSTEREQMDEWYGDMRTDAQGAHTDRFFKPLLGIAVVLAIGILMAVILI
jgi:hypothetical protein